MAKADRRTEDTPSQREPLHASAEQSIGNSLGQSSRTLQSSSITTLIHSDIQPLRSITGNQGFIPDPRGSLQSPVPPVPPVEEHLLGNFSAKNKTKTLTPAENPPLVCVVARAQDEDSSGLRKSRSSPGFAHHLSQKLSTTFGNPTVIHRPTLGTRASIQSFNDRQPPTLQDKEKLNTQSSTDPSNYTYSSGAFFGDRSTRKTSLSSIIPSPYYRKNKERSERFERVVGYGNPGAAEADVRAFPLTPIEETTPTATPTIVTVEIAANAKIFFETHFNDLLSNRASPRSLRRRDFKARLQMEPLSIEQRERELHLWAIQESEQLRQTRVLKSRNRNITRRSVADMAGFEIVRVLGKGSFGVVRLVRERGSMQDDQPSPSPTASINQTWRRTSREELVNLRTSAFEALRSTLDGQRSSQRRESKFDKREVYAMKVIRKSDMLRNSQEGHLRAERDFLIASEKSRWVVPLVASFQDVTNLYLVMEYMVGGDFLGLLFRKDVLKEKKARWYIAEMILCVEETHRLRWIHRDVKPDNFLISASGHLKISDFGLAFDGHWKHDQSYFNNHRQSLMEKLGIKVEGDSLDRKEGRSVAAGLALVKTVSGRHARREKPQTDGPHENEEILSWRNRRGNRKLARSVVGTSQYMAPEVIRGELYDGRCDWWSIGIILYEVRRDKRAYFTIRL